MSKFIVTRYKLTVPQLKKPLKIAHVSDLHERLADELTELLKPEKPDLIAISGDTFERYARSRQTGRTKNHSMIVYLFYDIAFFVNRVFMRLFDRKNTHEPEYAYEFLREASKIAPVFMSLGNHEQELTREDFRIIAECSVTLLDNADVTVNINSNQLKIGGLSSEPDLEWLSRFGKSDGVKILLAHHPDCYDMMIRGFEIPVVLSGHNHGGQIRLFGRGLVSSGLKPFPKYDRGLFDNRMAVSAGCSNTAAIPRLFNPKELVIVELSP
jgi:predicted MPP superfamily phosphohydrolase